MKAPVRAITKSLPVILQLFIPITRLTAVLPNIWFAGMVFFKKTEPPKKKPGLMCTSKMIKAGNFGYPWECRPSILFITCRRFSKDLAILCWLSRVKRPRKGLKVFFQNMWSPPQCMAVNHLIKQTGLP